jgi:hypothetical protein
MNWMEPLLHWLAVHTGTVNEGGPFYGFWSGIGSDIGEVAILGGVISLYRKHSCHTSGCWRIGKHTVDGTPWCSRHHQGARDAVPKADVAAEVARQLDPVHQAIFRRLDDHADLIRSAAASVTPAQDVVAADGPVSGGAGGNPAKSERLAEETPAAARRADAGGLVDAPPAATTSRKPRSPARPKGM